MRRRGGQGKGDETMSTGCELHCVLRLGCRGPFVLSRGGGGGGGGRHTGTRLTTSWLDEQKAL